MAGALSFLASGWQGFGYYLSHWNSDPFSIGCVIVLVLVISGYFYGCIYRNMIPSLRSVDCTLFGILTILALFQAMVFCLVLSKGSTTIAYYGLAVIVLISPVLCLFTWSSVIPRWENLIALVLGLLITGVLVYGSMNLNTNNIYFDSITYLSEVIESSKNEIFAHMVYPSGAILKRLDPLHDYTGYYYFWGMLLRWASGLFHFDGILTPIYIWGATALYGMSLAMLTGSSVSALYRKNDLKGLLFTVAFMAPFYTNYFNTTLAFFGNTIRTVVIGAIILIAYLILRNQKSISLFALLTIAYYAGLNVSSSSLFLIAFVTAGLFFSLAIAKENDWKRWAGFIVSLMPLVHMAVLVVFNDQLSYVIGLLISVAVIALLVGVAYLLRNSLLTVDKVFMYLLPAAFVILAAVSFLKRGSAYGYSYFFRSSSQDDMTVNMTSHVSMAELVRNLIFYSVVVLMLVNYRYQKKFKLFLIIIAVLFINPLTQPAVSNYLTSGVYSRVFDILVNPFTLCFMLFSLSHLAKAQVINWALMAVLCCFMLKLGYDTLTTSYSKSLSVGTDEHWNWEAKVMDDSYDMYEYINKALSSNHFDIREREYDDRPRILSQDSGLKGYVTGIDIAFTTEDYRSALAGDATDPYSERMISLMYPDRRYTEDDFGDVGDYSKLDELFIESGADYVVINNTLALWDERGWYASPYEELVRRGMCTVIYENESWALLQMKKEYVPAGKHNDRYWVHKYEEE